MDFNTLLEQTVTSPPPAEEEEKKPKGSSFNDFLANASVHPKAPEATDIVRNIASRTLPPKVQQNVPVSDDPAKEIEYFRQSAREREEGKYDRDTAKYWIEERLPGPYPAVKAISEGWRLRKAAQNVQAGTSTAEDHAAIGRYLARQDFEAGKSDEGKAVDILTRFPTFMAEWAAGGGFGAAGAVRQGTKRFLGQGGLAGLGGVVAEGAIRTAGMPSTYGQMGGKLVKPTEEGLVPVDPAEAALKGGVSALVQNTLFVGTSALAPGGQKGLVAGTVGAVGGVGRAMTAVEGSKETLYHLIGEGDGTSVRRMLGPNWREGLKEVAPELLAFSTLEAILHIGPAVRAKATAMRRKGLNTTSPAVQEAITKEVLAELPEVPKDSPLLAPERPQEAPADRQLTTNRRQPPPLDPFTGEQLIAPDAFSQPVQEAPRPQNAPEAPGRAQPPDALQPVPRPEVAPASEPARPVAPVEASSGVQASQEAPRSPLVAEPAIPPQEAPKPGLTPEPVVEQPQFASYGSEEPGQRAPREKVIPPPEAPKPPRLDPEGKLSATERKVMELRELDETGKPKLSFQEVANRLGLKSRQRAEQLEKSAREKLGIEQSKAVEAATEAQEEALRRIESAEEKGEPVLGDNPELSREALVPLSRAREAKLFGQDQVLTELITQYERAQRSGKSKSELQRLARLIERAQRDGSEWVAVARELAGKGEGQGGGPAEAPGEPAPVARSERAPATIQRKPAPATMNPQAREEFLRDVIAVMRGQESPGFHPDQAEVTREAEHRLAAATTPKDKRAAINAAEKEWQAAKEGAATSQRKPQPTGGMKGLVGRSEQGVRGRMKAELPKVFEQAEREGLDVESLHREAKQRYDNEMQQWRDQDRARRAAMDSLKANGVSAQALAKFESEGKVPYFGDAVEAYGRDLLNALKKPGEEPAETLFRVLGEDRPPEPQRRDFYEPLLEEMRQKKKVQAARDAEQAAAAAEDGARPETGPGAKTEEVAPGVRFSTIVPPVVARAVEKVFKWAVTNRDPGYEPPVKVDTVNRLPRFQEQPEEMALATSPRGLDRIGALGKAGLPSPRAWESADTPEGAAIITHRHQYHKARQLGQLEYIHQQQYRDLFVMGPDGKIALTDGTRGFRYDTIEREHANPGSQPITPAERAWVRDEWAQIHKSAVEMQAAEGMRPDATVKKGYMHRPAIGKRNVSKVDTDPSGTGKLRPGGKRSHDRSRTYETEQEGYESPDSIIYDPDLASAVGKYVTDVYRKVADFRLGNDKALGGKEPHEIYQMMVADKKPELDALRTADPNAYIDMLREINEMSHKRWGVYEGIPGIPAFEGKLYPVQVKKAMMKAFGGGTSEAMKWLDVATQTSKTAVLGAIDNAAPFVQGQLLLYRDPATWVKATVATYKSMFDPKFRGEYLRQPENARAAQEIVQAGGSIGLPEYLAGTEHAPHVPDFMGQKLKSMIEGQNVHEIPSLLSDLPLIGGFYRGSSRAVSAFFDVAKIELWKAYREVTPPEQWASKIENIENMLLLGRHGEARGMGQGHTMFERLAAMAPAYYRGAADLVASAVSGPNKAATLRVLGSWLAGTGLVAYGLMKYVAGLSDDEIEDRFKKMNFKAPIPVPGSDKKVEVGPGNVLTSVMKLVRDAYVYHAEKENPIDTGVEGNPYMRFLRQKSAFVPGLIADAATGKDFKNKRQPFHEALMRRFEPMMVQSMLHGEGDAKQSAAEAFYQYFGLQAHPQGEHNAYRDRLNQQAGPGGYDSLPLNKRAKVVEALEKAGKGKPESEFTPEMAARVEANRQERQARVAAALGKDNRAKLLELGRKPTNMVPLPLNTITVDKVKVPLTQKEVQRYEALLVAEYNRELGQVNAKAMQQYKPEYRAKVVQQRLENAKERAEMKLRQEIGR